MRTAPHTYPPPYAPLDRKRLMAIRERHRQTTRAPWCTARDNGITPAYQDIAWLLKEVVRLESLVMCLVAQAHPDDTDWEQLEY